MVKKLTIVFVLAVAFNCQTVMTSQIVKKEGFGSNPGNLNSYQYIPSGMDSSPSPLVVVLHGCSQSAASYDKETEWHKLAEKFKFYILYVEQKQENHQALCFRFAEKAHRQRDNGEPLSIKQMIDDMKTRFPIDSKRIYITGISAGASMAMNMISVYPEVFAGAGLNAGLPYLCDKDSIGVFTFCMPGKVNRTQSEWLERIKKGAPDYKGAYPKIIAIHGDSDQFVDPVNLEEITKQWTAVHKLNEKPAKIDTFREHTHKIFTKNNQPDGEVLVETYLIKYMDHGTSIDPGTKEDQGGSVVKYEVDGITLAFAHPREFHAPYYIAKFFGLVKKTA